MSKVYLLGAPDTTLAVSSEMERARRWRDKIRERDDGPDVKIYEMVLDDPPPVCEE